MNGLIYHMAYQAARTDDMRAAAARHPERPARRRLIRRSF
jgi:hypothetical protein